MTATSHQHQQQQVVLTTIGSTDSDQVGYFAASMGLTIPMCAVQYQTKVTVTVTATVTSATATNYDQLLYGAVIQRIYHAYAMVRGS